MANATFIPVDRRSLTASAAITEYRFVDFEGNQAVSGERAFGIAEFSVASGGEITVITLGSALLELGGSVSKGDKLTGDASGKGIVITSSSEIFNAIALSAGSSGDIIEVWVVNSQAIPYNQPITRKFSLTYNQIVNTSYNFFDMPAGSILLDAFCEITTLFSGGTPSIDIGDEDQSDDIIPSSSITEGSVGWYACKDSLLGVYLWDDTAKAKIKKVYEAAKELRCAGSASLAAGAIDIYITYMMLP